MDRFDALQAFTRVVEAGSFTKAAQTLHISKTTVTQLIQQLEARLRVKLPNRTTRQVKLTADGAAYYERIAQLLADLEDADASLSSASASPKGRLRVDVPSPFALMILVPALPAFHARYPDIQLDIGVSDRMVDLIGDNVDCVLRGGDLPDSSLIARRIGELRLGVYAAPHYLDAAGTPSHPRELNGTHHRIVGFLSPRSGRVASVALRSRCGAMASVARASGSKAAMRSPSMTETRTSRQGSRASAFSGCRTTWRKRPPRDASWCRYSTIGNSSPCRCIWRIRPIGTSA